jgi:hypothetical protein
MNPFAVLPKRSLRQFESETKGNGVMQIWLGKRYLGQRDNLDQNINTDLQIKADWSKLWCPGFRAGSEA